MIGIVKSVMLDAPPHHVWPALTDAKAFGTWFGAEFDGSFTVDRSLGSRARAACHHGVPGGVVTSLEGNLAR